MARNRPSRRADSARCIGVGTLIGSNEDINGEREDVSEEEGPVLGVATGTTSDWKRSCCCCLAITKRRNNSTISSSGRASKAADLAFCGPNATQLSESRKPRMNAAS
mmetsp:Transcript_36426/g.42526  ORF Transcript_36426/g.42526 Transcript_36426/m.42526 type:complete len:107 (+) Transcript_36426:913-1233(+)